MSIWDATVDDLPDELIEMVFARVGEFASVAAARLVCRRWYGASLALCEPVDAYAYGYCLQTYMEAHGGRKPSPAQGFNGKADVVCWTSTGQRALVAALPRPYDLATCASDLGDRDNGGSASDERCPRCAVHPDACTCVIPIDPFEWTCGEPRPLCLGWCYDDVYDDRYPDPRLDPDGACRRAAFAVRRTPPLSHWRVITCSIDNANGDARAAAIYVGRCCGLLVAAGGCSQGDIATLACSAVVRRAHNFANDRLCRADGKGYAWPCQRDCDADDTRDEICGALDANAGDCKAPINNSVVLCPKGGDGGESIHRRASHCVHNFFEIRCRFGRVRYYYDSHNVELEPDFDLDATVPTGGITAY